MSTGLSISDGRVGIVHYTLTNSDGEIIDSSQGRDPMPYLHGAQNIIPGLEKALEGKVADDEVKVVVAPEDGYGEADGIEPQRVKRSDLPKGQEWTVGTPLNADMGDGNVIQLWVCKSEGAWVWLTANHPLAGVELHFDVKVVRVREALPGELEHGHPTGSKAATPINIE